VKMSFFISEVKYMILRFISLKRAAKIEL